MTQRENPIILFTDKCTEYFSRVLNYKPECKAVFIVLLCSLVNMFLSIVSVVVIGIYLLCKGQFIKALKEANNVGMFLFTLLSLMISLLYLNIVGAAATIVMFLCFIIVITLRQNITRGIFEDIISLYLSYSVFAFFIAAIERMVAINSDPMYRSSSTFSNPLYYSYFVTFAIVICAYRLVTSPNNRIIHTIILAVNMSGMLFSGSRMPWIGVFAGILITFALCKKYNLVSIFAIVFALMIMVAILFPEWKILEALRLTTVNTAYNGRIPYWKYALNGILDRPLFGRGFLGILNDTMKADGEWTNRIFGVFDGLKGFTDMKESGWMLHAHNIVFDCLYNFGIAGSLLLVFCFLKYCTQMYRNCGCRASNPYIALFVGLIVSIAVNGVVDCEIIGAQTGVFSVILFAMTGLSDKTSTTVKESPFINS